MCLTCVYWEVDDEVEPIALFIIKPWELLLRYGYITSRKQGIGHRAVFKLAPVQSRTGTHGGIRPGS